MTRPLILNQDRLFPADAGVRGIARELYANVRGLPIISPHGHCDPAWFASNAPFINAADLLLAPDHYLYRMLYSQGVALEDQRVRTVPARRSAIRGRRGGGSRRISTCSAARRRRCG